MFLSHAVSHGIISQSVTEGYQAAMLVLSPQVIRILVMSLTERAQRNIDNKTGNSHLLQSL